ncbi:WD40 repeat domain-containing protein [Pseudochryseolinea flava]|uniref:WD40 repeat domain-containing protein n=1 Tax=Pseudochryseolinea flava TaxID=2059302 RepID=A0A364Y029_9BACT|nr:WD40 repeat domain-containing protein [Pseudochryseolinea flava]RAV99419.1 WD40 repeat domain-containing protein [Pseudochryseolinea flava]
MSKIEVLKRNTLTGHRDCVYTLQPSAESSVFFSGSGDGMVVLWDLRNPENGEVVAKLPNSVYALHYHQFSNTLIVGHNYDGIHVIDYQNKKEIGSLQLTKGSIFDIQSLGNWVWIATGDGEVIKVNLRELTIEAKVKYSERSARCMTISAERSEIAVGYSDNRIRILDLETMALKQEWEAHTNSVFVVRYSPDGTLLVSGSRDARLKSWDSNGGYTLSTEVVAHLFAINHLDFSPDSKHFVTCSMDKSIKVWDAATFKLLKVIDRARHAGHGNSVNKLLWTPYNDQLLSAGDDRTISVWNIIF